MFPFRQLDDLLVPEIVDRVPDNVKYFACALYWAPGPVEAASCNSGLHGTPSSPRGFH